MPPTQIVLRIQLDEDLHDHYAAQAILAGKEPEAFIVEHLTRTRDYLDANPIYVTGAQAAEIRKILGGRTNSGLALVEGVRRLASWSLTVPPNERVTLELLPAVWEQLYWRARSEQRDPKQAIPELIINAVREKLQV